MLDPRLYQDPMLEDLVPLEKCLDEFTKKRGTLRTISKNSSGDLLDKIHFNSKDAVYPICSGAQCRSQVLFALLKKAPFPIVLFPPHAARYGHDPYNNQINLSKRKPCPDDDAYIAAFGHPKSDFFGNPVCSQFEIQGHFDERLNYYNEHFFGPKSALNGEKGVKRTYIAFAEPVHATLKRLNDANNSLEDVTLIAIPLVDEITHPPENAPFERRTKEAYIAFAKKLSAALPF